MAMVWKWSLFLLLNMNSFHVLKRLKILDLKWNEINEIDSNGFQGLENLEEFYLDYNRLTKIESNSFRHLTKLRILNLANNQINEIDSNDFRWGGGLGQLEVFSFENNRLTRQAFLRATFVYGLVYFVLFGDVYTRFL